MRKEKNAQSQLPRARANIELGGKGLEHVYRAHVAYRMMKTRWPFLRFCELSSVNGRELCCFCDMRVRRFKIKTQCLCSVRHLDCIVGHTSHAAHCTGDAGRGEHSP